MFFILWAGMLLVCQPKMQQLLTILPHYYHLNNPQASNPIRQVLLAKVTINGMSNNTLHDNYRKWLRLINLLHMQLLKQLKQNF